MMGFISFIYGAALFSLFRFFPITSAILLAAAAVLIVRRKRYVLLLIVVLGISYAYVRFSPGVETLDLWNKKLTLTGRFLPSSSAPFPGSDAKTFSIDTALEDESDSEIEDLQDKDATVFTDFEADSDEVTAAP